MFVVRQCVWMIKTDTFTKGMGLWFRLKSVYLIIAYQGALKQWEKITDKQNFIECEKATIHIKATDNVP